MTIKLPFNPKYDIADAAKELAESRKISETDVPSLRTIVQIRGKNNRLLACDEFPPHQIYGYADFAPYEAPEGIFHYTILRAVAHDLLELKFLKIEPEYFGNNIGTLLLNAAKNMATASRKKVLLRPEQPGLDLPPDEKNARFPLSTEQLRGFYLKRGFREFSEEETRGYVITLDVFDPMYGLMLKLDPEPILPPKPTPRFSDKLTDRVLEQLYKQQEISIPDFIEAQLDQRRELGQWRRDVERIREEHRNTRYKRSPNYDAVKSYLVQA